MSSWKDYPLQDERTAGMIEVLPGDMLKEASFKVEAREIPERHLKDMERYLQIAEKSDRDLVGRALKDYPDRVERETGMRPESTDIAQNSRLMYDALRDVRKEDLLLIMLYGADAEWTAVPKKRDMP